MSCSLWVRKRRNRSRKINLLEKGDVERFHERVEWVKKERMRTIEFEGQQPQFNMVAANVHLSLSPFLSLSFSHASP